MNGFGGADADIVLVGAGIMSATLAAFLKELEPRLQHRDVRDARRRRAGELGCLEQCRHRPRGPVRAQLHAGAPRRQHRHLARRSRSTSSSTCRASSGRIWCARARSNPRRSFIHPVPHMSFVQGAANVAFLKKRMPRSPRIIATKAWNTPRTSSMLAEWIPLVMEGRAPAQQVAATRMVTGTDVELRRAHPQPVRPSADADGFAIALSSPRDGHPSATAAAGGSMPATDETARKNRIAAKFVFLGAGGGALPLLQKSGIPEGNGYAGFPVSGIWLRCDDPTSTSATTPRSTARPRSARRRCRCRISTRA